MNDDMVDHDVVGEDQAQRNTPAEDSLLMANNALELQVKELSAALSLLKGTLESTADGIIALDVAGNIVFYNSKFVSIWQFPEELIRKRDRPALMQYSAQQVKDPEGFLKLIQKRQKEAKTESVDIIELKDGRIFERYSSSQQLNGVHVGVVINFREITRHRQVERDLARFAAIVDSSHDAIISKTTDGIITSWNKGAERIFGYLAEEAIGQSILIILPPERSDEETEILARLRRGETVDHFETVRIRKDGRKIHISITVSPIKDRRGEIIAISKIARDITGKKAAEAEREELLEREQQAREEAEAANRVKDEFLATLSHELRTPLNAILGWSSLVSDARTSEADRAQGLEIIQRSARLQARLIEDVLDVSRIISGKLRLDVRTIDMCSIIEDAVESVLPAVEAKGLRLQRVLDSGPSLISGDSSRLQQVVWNLLTNAIKFTPEGGRVQILLESTKSHLEISVIDNGAGISAEVLPHVFERFRQGDQSSTRNYGGLGLGLAIVRHIVEMHGGTVEAYSAGEGQGATFKAKLPLLTRPTTGVFPESETVSSADTDNRNIKFDCPSQLKGVHVLVVDDEESARLLVRTILENCQVQVTTVSNAIDALDALKTSRPDVLLSDLGMPGEDGYSLISKVRNLSKEQGGQTPAVALTAYARNEDKRRVLSSGFQVYLAKPIEPADLVTAIASLVK